MLKNLSLHVVDSVFDPKKKKKKVFVRQREKSTLYKVYLYISGGDVPFVQQVTYRLHSSFPNPDRQVYRTPSNPDCQLIIWTWGLFTVQVTVQDKNGYFYTFEHRMSYDRELTNVPAENYVWEK